jgi:hypothetical protein
MELMERTLSELERTRNEFNLSACVNARDSNEETEKQRNEERRFEITQVLFTDEMVGATNSDNEPSQSMPELTQQHANKDTNNYRKTEKECDRTSIDDQKLKKKQRIATDRIQTEIHRLMEESVERRTDEEGYSRMQNYSEQSNHRKTTKKAVSRRAKDATRKTGTRTTTCQSTVRMRPNRQYSVRKYERIERLTIKRPKKERNKQEQETCKIKVISNGHNKRPRVRTSKGAYKKAIIRGNIDENPKNKYRNSPCRTNQIEVEESLRYTLNIEKGRQAQRSMLHCKGVLDLLCASTEHYPVSPTSSQNKFEFHVFRVFRFKNLEHQAISS